MRKFLRKICQARIESIQSELNHLMSLRDDFPKETYFWLLASLNVERLKIKIAFYETLLG